MTPREKVLSMGVGVALFVAVGSYAFSSIKKGFRAKYDRIDQLQSEVIKKDTLITDGLLNRNKLSAISSRSLPRDVERAQSDYNAWLLQVSDEAGLRGPKQTFDNRLSQELGVYNLYKFTLSGTGTIENLTKLLYAFYQKDYLHRITSLRVTPVTNAPYQLTITLHIEVLGLEAASSKQPPPATISHRVDKPLEEYQEAILKRNLFSPANHAPTWPDRLTRQASRGRSFNYQPEAKDADDGQSLRYEVVGPLPDGMRLTRSGELEWIPEVNGKYQVKLVAIDNGIPQQKSEQELTIEVVDPPEPEKPAPKLDIAMQAEVSAFVTRQGVPEAWIRSKLEGKTVYLKVGDELSLGSVHGKVVAVGANYLELETSGKRWTVGLDESLADAFRRLSSD